MEYDCLLVGARARCEDCKYGKFYKSKRRNYYACDPKKLEKDGITKVGMGILEEEKEND